MPPIDLHSQIFVTGTGTDIGKTVVSAMLVAGLAAHYWKPVQSGIEGMTDTEWVKAKTGLPKNHFHSERYRFRFPLSPHAAAQKDGVRIDLTSFTLPPTGGNPLIVEGAGGLLVPLNERELMIDLMEKLALPVLLVAQSGLGTINHTLLSLEALRQRRLTVLGVVMNGPLNPENRQAIETFGRVRVLAQIPPLHIIDPINLKTLFDENFR